MTSSACLVGPGLSLLLLMNQGFDPYEILCRKL